MTFEEDAMAAVAACGLTPRVVADDPGLFVLGIHDADHSAVLAFSVGGGRPWDALDDRRVAAACERMK